jgi:pimeloyl-ACP methyl ester carboxylesterase
MAAFEYFSRSQNVRYRGESGTASARPWPPLGAFAANSTWGPFEVPPAASAPKRGNMLQCGTYGNVPLQDRNTMSKPPHSTTRWLTGAAATAAAGVAAAFYNRFRTKQAEAETPPVGSFIEAEGAKLHYLRRGSGPCIVLLHGNGVMLQDWLASGVFDELAKNHDVIAFDRPGFGYSSRPRSIVWTPQAQAAALASALKQLGVEEATVVGHSFGTLVALALGLNHALLVSRLVLLGGYYFPTARPDLVMNAGPAVPIVGDLMRHTISPIAGRAMMPGVEKILFSPAPVDAKWKQNFPVNMVTRPSQVRATAADAAMAIPAAASLSKRYKDLTLPTTILAGAGDKIVRYEGQSRRLHETLSNSQFVRVDDVGHMIHYSARDTVLKALIS